MKRVATLAVIAAVLTGPALAGDKEDIQALNDKFSAAINRGDTTAVIAMYAPGATLLPPASDPVPASGAKAMFDGMAKSAVNFKLTTDRVDRLSPDYMQEIGDYSFQSRADPSKSQKASYVVIWKRVGGQWKLWTDIFH